MGAVGWQPGQEGFHRPRHQQQSALVVEWKLVQRVLRQIRFRRINLEMVKVLVSVLVVVVVV